MKLDELIKQLTEIRDVHDLGNVEVQVENLDYPEVYKITEVQSAYFDCDKCMYVTDNRWGHQDIFITIKTIK